MKLFRRNSINWYYSADSRQGRIFKKINRHLQKANASSLSGADEQKLAVLSYREASNRQTSQNTAIVIAVSALLTALLFSSGTAFESVFKSSETNDRMVMSDQFYALVFAMAAWVLAAVIVAILGFVFASQQAAGRTAALAIETYRLNDQTVADLVQQIADVGDSKRVFTLINVNR